MTEVFLPPPGGHFPVWRCFRRAGKVAFCVILLGRPVFNELILAGYFIGEPDNPDYLDFLKELNLKDSAKGFCELEINCHTQSQENALLSKTDHSKTPKRNDRILVHKSTKVIKSFLAYTEQKPSPEFLKNKYNLKYLPASLRYGWETEIVFSSCIPNNKI